MICVQYIYIYYMCKYEYMYIYIIMTPAEKVASEKSSVLAVQVLYPSQPLTI